MASCACQRFASPLFCIMLASGAHARNAHDASQIAGTGSASARKRGASYNGRTLRKRMPAGSLQLRNLNVLARTHTLCGGTLRIWLAAPRGETPTPDAAACGGVQISPKMMAAGAAVVAPTPPSPGRMAVAHEVSYPTANSVGQC